MSKEKIDKIVTQIGCYNAKLPLLYLVEKIIKRLDVWKRRVLAKGGSLVLLQSVYQTSRFTISYCSKCQNQCLLLSKNFLGIFFGTENIWLNGKRFVKSKKKGV